MFTVYEVFVDAEGTRYWYQDDELSRLDGPAIEYKDGSKAWFIRGEELTEQQFNERMKG